MSEIKVDIGNGEGELVTIPLPEGIKVGETLETQVGSTLLVIKAATVEPKKLYRDESWLREAYLGKMMTMAELGSMFNVSPMTICTWLDKFGIETRSRGRRK